MYSWGPTTGDSNLVNLEREMDFSDSHVLTGLGSIANVNWLDYVMKPILAKTDFSKDQRQTMRKLVKFTKLMKLMVFLKVEL